MDRKSFAALVAVQSLFGLLPVAGKLAFESFHPLSLGAIRVAVAAVILWVVQAVVAKRTIDLNKDGWTVAKLAFFGIVLNQTLFVLGLQKTSAINATLIITTIPVVTYALAVILGRESWGPRRLVGMALALAGVAYLIGMSGYQFGWDSALGDLLIFLNCCSFSLYLVLSKPIASRVNPLNLIAWQFIMAAVVMVPIGVWAGVFDDVQVAQPIHWWMVAFIILGPTVATYVLNTTALRSVSSSTVAVFIYIQPVFTTLFAWWLLKEPLTWRLLPAAALVFIGVGIVARRSAVAASAVPAD